MLIISKKLAYHHIVLGTFYEWKDYYARQLSVIQQIFNSYHLVLGTSTFKCKSRETPHYKLETKEHSLENCHKWIILYILCSILWELAYNKISKTKSRWVYVTYNFCNSFIVSKND